MTLSLQDIHPGEYDILIVDDNPENLKVLGNFLVEQGFNIRIARDGQQALESVAAEPPEVILLDIHMPVLDGYETCRRLKESEDSRDIPVIFLSALGETFNKVRAFELGGADYISKPFELEEVRMRVGVHLLANRLLAESKAGFRASFEQATSGMLHVQLGGTIIAANACLSAMLGLEQSALLGSDISKVLPGNLATCLREQTELLRSQDTPVEPREIQCPGIGGEGYVWYKVNCSLVRITSNRAPYVAAIIQDITERKDAEQERRRMLAALERAPDAIALTDAAGFVLYANQAYIASRNLSEADYRGIVHCLFDAGDDEQFSLATIQSSVNESGSWYGRTTSIVNGGTKIIEEHRVSAIEHPGESGHNYIIISRDISGQLKLENQLRQSQKMEAIGTLAAGIAHDFNNLLAAISGFTELALEDLPNDMDAATNLREVKGAVERARELVRQILAFGRQSEYQVYALELPAIVLEVIRLLRRTIPPTIEIETHLDETCPPVQADPTAIHQIMMNLCTNAYHAMEAQGGTLSIRLTHSEIAEEQLQGHPDLPPGSYARIEVSDTGMGMDENTRQRIFEPYFTTKEHAGGTGLGLATVHGIVSELKGAIHVYSELGLGSTFSIILPTAAATDRPAAPDQHDLAEGNGEHVLFVDDESTICRFAEKALLRLGYRVSAMTDPLQALACFAAEPGAYDVIVTDEMMPGMRGSDLLGKVRNISPTTPVILYSGFAGSHHKRANTDHSFDGYVMKPMVTSDLSRAIQQALKRKA